MLGYPIEVLKVSYPNHPKPCQLLFSLYTHENAVLKSAFRCNSFPMHMHISLLPPTPTTPPQTQKLLLTAGPAK